MAALDVIRNRDLLLLWSGQVTSQAGTRMYQIAMLWWLLKQPGGSGVHLGLFMVFGALPQILLVKPIGRLIERSSSKQLMVACDLLSAGVVFAITGLLYAGQMSVPAAYVAGFLVPLFHAVFNPTLNKAVAEIAPPELIGATVALQSSSQSMASFGGAVLGAMLIDAIGVPAVALFNAASYVVSGLCLLAIPFRYARPPAPPAAGQTDASGWAVLDRIPAVKGYLIGFGLANFFSVPTLIVLPVYTAKVLNASASVLGQLEASLWLGLVGGAFASGWTARIRDPRHIGFLCIATMGTCLMLPGFVVQQHFYMAMLALVGLALGINNVRFVSMFQQVVPAELKGRFFAVLQATIGFSFPLAYMVFGLLTSRIDPTWVCVVQGAGTCAVAVFFLNQPDPTKTDGPTS